MKRIGSLDIDRNLKLRGKVVDKLVVEGGFYSQQFGESVYRDTLAAGSNVTLTTSGNTITIASTGGSGGAGGFYGIVVKDTSNTQKFRGINLLNFNFEQFYLTQNTPNTDEAIINVRALGLTGPAGPAGPAGSNTLDISDGVETFNDTDALFFNSDHFYLSKTSTGKPVANLASGYIEIKEAASRSCTSSATNFINMSRVSFPGPTNGIVSYKVTISLQVDSFQDTGNSNSYVIAVYVGTNGTSADTLIENIHFEHDVDVLTSGIIHYTFLVTPSSVQPKIGLAHSCTGGANGEIIGTAAGGNRTSRLIIEKLH